MRESQHFFHSWKISKTVHVGAEQCRKAGNTWKSKNSSMLQMPVVFLACQFSKPLFLYTDLINKYTLQVQKIQQRFYIIGSYCTKITLYVIDLFPKTLCINKYTLLVQKIQNRCYKIGSYCTKTTLYVSELFLETLCINILCRSKKYNKGAI